VEREILNHSLLIHPHVVQFKHCFLTRQYLAIAMEYAEGGTMHAHVLRKCALLSAPHAPHLSTLTCLLALRRCHNPRP
jgi:serine/threonine-protein kinase SRK2